MTTTVKTGEYVQVSGIYYCQTHSSHEETLIKGHKAPPCDHTATAHGATWVLRRATHN